MKTYSVSYSLIGSAQPSMKLENVIADGGVPETNHRWFLTETGERHEIPTPNVSFHFSKERTELIEENERAKREHEKADANAKA